VRTLRTLLLAALTALTALAFVPAASTTSERAASSGRAATRGRAATPVDAGIVRTIHHYRDTTARLARIMGLSRQGQRARLDLSRQLQAERRGRPSARRALALWRGRARAARRRFRAGPAHHRAWLCIHRYEGSWTDRGAPYYGGLQMDIAFQQRYGSLLLRLKGTADHWTPLEQMWVAEKAYRSGRGFYPWPNTARSCGLL
jgi:hypothetical protein